MYFSESFLRAQDAYDALEPDWPDDDDEEEPDEPDYDLINDCREDEKAERKAQLELDRYLNWLYK